MKNIKLKDVDLLDEAFTKINMYAYFLSLVEYDKQEHIIPYENIDSIQQSAELLISDNILNEIHKINQIISKKDFLF